MRTYEVVFIAAPTMAGDELDAFTEQMKEVVESRNGKVVKVDSWGKKSLAYKINKFRDGQYVILTLEADGEIIAEMERRFRVSEQIIRFLTVRIDEGLKRSEKLKAIRQRKVARKRPAPGAQGGEAEAAPV